jgi:hypothetical protein
MESHVVRLRGTKRDVTSVQIAEELIGCPTIFRAARQRFEAALGPGADGLNIRNARRIVEIVSLQFEIVSLQLLMSIYEVRRA